MNPTPTVVYATLYPRDAGRRGELFVTRELVREYLENEAGWRLQVVIASAHAEGLEAGRRVMAEFPQVPSEFLRCETPFAGQRAEEISFCKERLPQWLTDREFDFLLFMDADVWTSLRQVPEWMSIIGEERARRYVKIKYTLRDMLQSPAHTLGAYFHHKELLTQLEYWRAVYPRKADGRRAAAPDCCLHGFFEAKGCQKIVPPSMATAHFLNERDAHLFQNGLCKAQSGVRDADGRWAKGFPEAISGTPDRPMPKAVPARAPWINKRELAMMERLLRREDRVLEFGAGGSTAWLAERVREVHSVEHSRIWLDRIAGSLPGNVTMHLRSPAFRHRGCEPAKPGQFAEYVRTPEQLGVTFDACLVDGRARVDCAVAAAPWLRACGLLFFHDWFPRRRYTSRLGELEPFYELREEWCVRDSPQTLAVFARRGA